MVATSRWVGEGGSTVMIKALAAVMTVVLTGVSALAAPARADDGDPEGAFDSVSVGFPLLSDQSTVPWLIHGWAADPDAPGQRVQVDVYVDGQPSTAFSPAAGPGSVQTGNPRPDVAAVIPFAGDNAGWSSAVI